MHPQLVSQLARLLGDDAVYGSLGLEEGACPSELSVQQLDALRALLDGRSGDLARGLLEEAAASDDVIDRASALAYLEDRLAFFSEVLTPEQAQRVRQAYEVGTERWG
ncbi:MAG TPA: hypothetical protein VNL15_00625 [Dehalococcoidia bacterium]|nr:hypothetical protein [Dehalococcoidia bacterium]